METHHGRSRESHNSHQHHIAMKTLWITFLAAATFSMTSCNKPPPSERIPTPKPEATPKPLPTPHPAQGASQKAILLYPDLARKDSMFNRTFLEMYEEQKKNNPDSLAAVDWPLTLAARTARMLEVQPHSEKPASKPKTAPTPPPKAKEPNPLDRGPYQEKRGVARPPTIRYVPRY